MLPLVSLHQFVAWADNADIISLQYAGAGALKVDFTRFGKRTVFGYALDGINAVQRYVLNNFFDGSRHDAYNLFLGYVRVKPGTTSPFLHDADVKRRNRVRCRRSSPIFAFLFTNCL